MKYPGLQGVRRGRRSITTLPAETAHKPLDWVQRQFTAARPNPLRVADMTYVPTGSGFVYVAFVVDVYSRYLPACGRQGWLAGAQAQADGFNPGRA